MSIDDNVTYRKLELKEHNKIYKIVNNLLKNPYVLIAPAVILALWMTVYPMLFCVYLSFHNWDLMTNEMTFIGLENFKFIFTNEAFLKSMINTLIFMVSTVVGGLVLQVIIGVFLNRNTKVHNLVQTVMFTPYIISSVVIAVVFKYLMMPDGGLLNTVIEFFGGSGLRWYMDEKTALFSIILITVWTGLGYGVLVVISGLKSIPNYIYEAARLDKSSKLNTFINITVPLLSPTLFFLLVSATVSAFTSFDTVQMLTKGGPNNATSLLAYYVYEQGLGFMHYGRAMAASVVLMLITCTLSFLNFMFAGKKVYYQ